MGQRLVINITNEGELLANAYYHWSAYTSSAAVLTQQCIDKYYEERQVLGRSPRTLDEKLYFAIKMLEDTGAGINQEEYALLETNVATEESGDFDRLKNLNIKTLNPAVDRNEGLLSLTTDGMSKSYSCAEGEVSLDLSDNTFMFDLYSYYNEEYTIQDEYGEDADIDYLPDEVDESEFDSFASYHNFSDFSDFWDVIKKYPNGIRYQDCAYTWYE